MGRLLNLRISLADRAGALAQCATVIGLHGGSIVAVDIHRTAGDLAVDDIKVRFADDPDLADLVADLQANAAADLVSFEETFDEDPVVLAYAGATALIERVLESQSGPGSQSAPDWTETYRVAAQAVVTSARFALVERDDVEACETGREAIRSGAVTTSVTRDLPGSVSDPEGSDVGLLVAPLPGGRALVGVRPAGSAWTTTEAQRIETVVGFVGGLRESVERD